VAVTADGVETPIATKIAAAVNAAVATSMADAEAQPSDYPVTNFGAGFIDFFVLGDQYLSLTFDEATMLERAAHGSPTPVAFTFDLMSGDPVDPLTFFRTRDDGLRSLSDATRPRLEVYLGSDRSDDASRQFLEAGSAPTPENFRTLVPRPDGLMARFEPGQFGAFADGLVNVIVPWTELDQALTAGAVPQEWRTTATYTIGAFIAAYDGVVPADLGPVMDVFQLPTDNGGWVFATIRATGDVVLLRVHFDDPHGEHPLWEVEARGPWPLACDTANAEVVQAQGIDC